MTAPWEDQGEWERSCERMHWALCSLWGGLPKGVPPWEGGPEGGDEHRQQQLAAFRAGMMINALALFLVGRLGESVPEVLKTLGDDEVCLSHDWGYHLVRAAEEVKGRDAVGELLKGIEDLREQLKDTPAEVIHALDAHYASGSKLFSGEYAEGGAS